jgi:5-(carboxyamino)imidazole ribonucleotide synthase
LGNILTKRIGIIGGGQLGKMMILEAKRLGLYVVTLDPTADCPSHSISDEHIVAQLYDAQQIRKLAGMVDVITYESEHINADVLIELEREGKEVYPTAASLKLIQDKFTQKETLRNNNIKVPGFEAINSLSELRAYAEKTGYPIMLKSRRDGYDGKGNFVLHNESDLEKGFSALKGDVQGLMVEEFIDYEIEVSVIATRGVDGSKAVYPIGFNVHKNSILDTTTVPVDLSGSLRKAVNDIVERTMDVFDGVGTFGVEVFVGKTGEVYINEVAPRPHNSGHYTIEGCRVNQFENHIRAIIGLPLGDTALLHNAVIMRNLLGLSNGRAVVDGVEEAYKLKGVNVHVYGKAESVIDRKMGHYTITADSLEEAKALDERVLEIVKIRGSKTNLQGGKRL